MLDRMTSGTTPNATFSPASAAGRKRLQSRVGQQTGLFGPAHAPVNPFRWPGLEEALRTEGISGRSSQASSSSLRLQLSLENRLRQQMDVNGSPEYALTWKRWDMQSGPPICALRASGRRTSGSGFGGWPTPTESLVSEQDFAQQMTAGNGKDRKKYRESMIFAGWATPSSRDWKDTPGMAQEAFEKSGKFRNRIDQLPRQAMFLTSGNPSNSSTASTENRGVLNPALPRWLMGFQAEWDSCGATAMRSIRG